MKSNEAMPVQLGEQLQQARETAQLTIKECGQDLRLPVRILEKLEAEDYRGIEHAVYLRNYLRSYGRYLGLDSEELEYQINELIPHSQQPTLVNDNGALHTHHARKKGLRNIAYLVLAIVIIAPLVWLGITENFGNILNRQESSGAQISVSSSAQPDTSAEASVDSGSVDVHDKNIAMGTVEGSSPQKEPTESAGETTKNEMMTTENVAQGTSPVNEEATDTVSSIVPDLEALNKLPSDDEQQIDRDAGTESSKITDANTSVDADSSSLTAEKSEATEKTDTYAHQSTYTLHIELTQDSWVKVATSAGKMLQYGLLKKGSVHNYQASGPVRVVIGNVHGTTVRVDQEKIPLNQHQDSNVARFRVAIERGELQVSHR